MLIAITMITITEEHSSPADESWLILGLCPRPTHERGVMALTDNLDCSLQHCSRLTSFLFLQADGPSRVPNGILGKANECLVKITPSHFLQVENTLNVFVLDGDLYPREGGRISQPTVETRPASSEDQAQT